MAENTQGVLLARIDDGVESIKKDVAGLRTDVAVLQRSLTTLESTLQSHDTDISKLREDITRVDLQALEMRTQFRVVWAGLGSMGAALLGIAAKVLLGGSVDPALVAQAQQAVVTTATTAATQKP